MVSWTWVNINISRRKKCKVFGFTLNELFRLNLISIHHHSIFKVARKNEAKLLASFKDIVFHVSKLWFGSKIHCRTSVWFLRMKNRYYSLTIILTGWTGYFAYTVNFNSSVKVFQCFFRATTCFEWKVNSNSGSAPSPNESYFKYEK